MKGDQEQSYKCNHLTIAHQLLIMASHPLALIIIKGFPSLVTSQAQEQNHLFSGN